MPCSPLIDENNTRVPTKEEAAALKMKAGSARDLHKDHIAALASKQGTTPEPSPVLGPRGGDRGDRERGARGGSDARREGPGWGERGDRGDRGDRDWDRFGDRCVVVCHACLLYVLHSVCVVSSILVVRFFFLCRQRFFSRFHSAWHAEGEEGRALSVR